MRERGNKVYNDDYWDNYDQGLYDIDQTYIDNNQCLYLPAEIILCTRFLSFYFSRHVTQSAENILASETTFDWLFTIHNTR